MPINNAKGSYTVEEVAIMLQKCIAISLMKTGVLMLSDLKNNSTMQKD